MHPELSRMNPPVALFRRQVCARWLRDRIGSSQPAVTEAVLPLSSPTFTVMDMLAGKLLALRLCGPTIVNSILSISIILITKLINGSIGSSSYSTSKNEAHGAYGKGMRIHGPP